MIEIGCIDIANKVSMLSSFLDYPQEGHLVAALQIMAYLKQKHKSRLFLEPNYHVIDKTTFDDDDDWKDFYGDATEEIPPDALDSRGKKLILKWWLIVTM